MARRSNLGIAKQIGRDINKKLAQAIQESAVEITNGLAEAGPAWTGTFSSAWDVVPAGGQGKPPRGGGRVYRYDRRNFPVSRFQRSLERGNNRFEIVNTAPHAAIALDQEEDIFAPPADQPYPVGDVVKFGTGRPRGEHLRYEISDVADNPDEEVTSQITAEKDWFPTYSAGGALSRDLRVGVDRAFVRKGGGI
jgi:hypothetical protein